MRVYEEIPSDSGGDGEVVIELYGFIMQVNLFKVGAASASMTFQIDAVFPEFPSLQEEEDPNLEMQIGETITVAADQTYQPFVMQEDGETDGTPYWADGPVKLTIASAGSELDVALRVVISVMS